MAVDLLSLPVPLTTRRISEALAYAEKASEFEIIRVMSELNQNGCRLIVQRVAPWWLFTSDGQAASGGKGRLDALRSDGI
jgi:hypothetical protein